MSWWKSCSRSAVFERCQNKIDEIVLNNLMCQGSTRNSSRRQPKVLSVNKMWHVDSIRELSRLKTAMIAILNGLIRTVLSLKHKNNKAETACHKSQDVTNDSGTVVRIRRNFGVENTIITKHMLKKWHDNAKGVAGIFSVHITRFDHFCGVWSELEAIFSEEFKLLEKYHHLDVDDKIYLCMLHCISVDII